MIQSCLDLDTTIVTIYILGVFLNMDHCMVLAEPTEEVS
jgi:hypothetical protein